MKLEVGAPAPDILDSLGDFLDFFLLPLGDLDDLGWSFGEGLDFCDFSAPDKVGCLLANVE